MTLSDEAVERVARIINPGSWAVMDGYLADMKRKYRGENIGYDPENFRHKESMAIARAALEASGLVDQIKALEAKLATAREALVIARDTFARYGDLHSAKKTEDAPEKARVNYTLATRMAGAVITLDAIKEKNGA